MNEVKKEPVAEPSLSLDQVEQVQRLVDVFKGGNLAKKMELVAAKSEIPEVVWQSEAVREAAKLCIVDQMTWSDYHQSYTTPMREAFGFSDADLVHSPLTQQYAKKVIIEGLSNVVVFIPRILVLPWPENVIKDPEVQGEVKKTIISLAQDHDFEGTDGGFGEEKRYFIEVQIKKIGLLARTFHLESEMWPEIEPHIQYKLQHEIEVYHDKIIALILETFPGALSADIQEKAQQQILVEDIGRKGGNRIARIVRMLKLNITPTDFYTSDRYYHKQDAHHVDEINEVMPGFRERVLQSNEMYFSFMGLEDREIEELKNNKHIVAAFEANPQMGAKLLAAFINFDEPSKENLKTIFAIRDDVLQDNTEEGMSFSEVRKKMQEALKDYKRNQEILDAMQEAGADTEAWLNHDEEYDVTVGGRQSSFSELATPPINNIRDALLSLKSKASESLRTHKDALMKKGAWNTLMKVFEILQRRFKNLETVTTLGKDLMAIRQNAKVLQKKVEEMLPALQTMLTEALDADGESAYSSVKDSVAEYLDDFQSNAAALEAVVAAKVTAGKDTKDVEVPKLDIRIRLWDRNPDVDLYLGNYTNCCIRIDSTREGAQATLSDYITDLGIQVVIAEDKNIGQPFAAAWCFLSSDPEGNKTLTFAIDNAEMDGTYAPYSMEMGKEMGDYIKRYAAKIGIPAEHIIQGTNANDFHMVDNNQYRNAQEKIGGYNRIKEGRSGEYERYYLESVILK